MLEEMDNTELLNLWRRNDVAQRACRDEMGRVELLLRQRMEADGAKEIPHPEVSCVLESRHAGYDLNALYALKELLPPDVIATAFTPAHDEVVHKPDAWDARKVNSWWKYGSEVAQAIARAELPRAVRLVLKQKREA